MFKPRTSVPSQKELGLGPKRETHTGTIQARNVVRSRLGELRNMYLLVGYHGEPKVKLFHNRRII